MVGRHVGGRVAHIGRVVTAVGGHTVQVELVAERAVAHHRRSPLSVQACDGCCCGTSRKHPHVDHPGQRERLAAATVAVGGGYRTVGCVGECSFSNVVVVRRGSRRWWIGHVLDPAVEEALCSWLSGGARGTPPPVVLDRCFHRAAGPARIATPTPQER